MIIEDFQSLIKDIKSRAETAKLNLNGPEEVEYGFGWSPTITFWVDNRRIHFYFDISEFGMLNVEVAEIHPELKIIRGLVETNSLVKKTTFKTTEEAWEIIENFLKQKCGFENLTAFSWMEETTDVDKFIPHPPNLINPANIVSFVDKLVKTGEVWGPEYSKKQHPWIKWLKSQFNNISK